ncbi:MAG: hypothetical protein N2747_08930 [Chitinophagaceae bacterium]|nr:hypothetical protein [Chitinophagaceae bacterium]
MGLSAEVALLSCGSPPYRLRCRSGRSATGGTASLRSPSGRGSPSPADTLICFFPRPLSPLLLERWQEVRCCTHYSAARLSVPVIQDREHNTLGGWRRH